MTRRKVLIVGGGGHAKVVIDILQEYSDIYEVIGFTSQSHNQDNLCGVPHLGDDSVISQLRDGVECFIVALGNNVLRKKLFYSIVKLGLTPINAISRAAYVSPYAHVGKGVVISAGAVVNACAVIQDNVIINTLAGVDHDCIVNSHAHIAPGASLAGGVRVGEGAFIGMKSSVIPDKIIGEWSTVGAGSAVVTDIPPFVTAVGVPAKKIIKQKDE